MSIQCLVCERYKTCLQYDSLTRPSMQQNESCKWRLPRGGGGTDSLSLGLGDLRPLNFRILTASDLASINYTPPPPPPPPPTHTQKKNSPKWEPVM